MKQLILLSAMLFSMTVMAQQPVITFNETTHDFGKINEADGRVTTVFEFKNEGMIPLVLTNVRASCGCTTPKWTREPIEPGQTGQITVTYNPNGRPGRFQKTVTITSNASEATIRLYIKGEVIPKPVKQTDQYPVKIGNLSVKKKTMNFGAVRKGQKKTLNFQYANTSDKVVKLDISMSQEYYFLKPYVTLKDIQPGQTGMIKVTLESNECEIYGPITAKIYLVVDGKNIKTDEYAITFVADIKEDFSQMTVEEMQQAPISELKTNLSLGTIAAGKKHIGKINISNIGIDPLIVRRAISNDTNISVIPPKTSIKNGRKADIKFEINTNNMKPAHYTRNITIITNDPKKPINQVIVTWKIE